MSGFHHVELWVADFAEAQAEWSWLLSRLGFTLESTWPDGQSWSAGDAYLTITTSPNLSTPVHDRRRAGVNHLAFKAESTTTVDAIIEDAPTHGWHPLYQDRYPHAGGEDHYAGWIENSAGFKAEVVAQPLGSKPESRASRRRGSHHVLSRISWVTRKAGYETPHAWRVGR